VFIPLRPDIVIKQLINEGLYPTVKAPEVTSNEGSITKTDNVLTIPLDVVIINPNSAGTIYYTLDGQDPRKIGGGIYSGALLTLDNANLTINASTILKSRILANGLWSALTQVNFIKQEEDFSNLKVTELNYHPPDYIVGTDTTSGKDIEFIELKNTGINSINLTGLELDSAVRYKFPESVLLPPKGFYVITSKPSIFYKYYGMIASGNYQGNFSNSGEEVLLKDSGGNKIINFIYDDSSPWPSLADGDGFSLSSVEVNPTGNPPDISYWTTSIVKDGTPFADNSIIQNPTDQLSEGSVVAYPNPTKGLITIHLISDKDINLLNISIYSLTGKLLSSSKIGNPGLLDLADIGLPDGVLFIRVSAEGINGMLRIILMN
jgi:hypothetical protein